MTLKGFDITLTPLGIQEIEMVRNWRNSDKVKRYALNQEYITPEQQLNWFISLQEKEDEYFVIHVGDESVGLIWFNKRDETIETGFYIYDESRQNSLTPYKIVTLFHDYLFNQKKFAALTCKIMPDNPRAVRFNLSLGYKEIETFDTYKSYLLTYEDYKKADAKISKLLRNEKR
ncbi:GNAT family N-acetyltransferase [bacterium]|nr:GNAT family N-acetyltransferase [bacterium]MBU1884215.1 GNAT family N-acetyltransferase [bacterium]